MNENVTPCRSSKQKKNAIISLFLIAALLITGIFAFLTSTDSKVNKFTIGKVDVTLQEYDGDTAWWEVDANTQHTTDELTTDVDENANGISDNMENILPGDYVGKKPVVTNLGKNDAWTYLVVAVPTAQKSDIVRAAGDNGVVGVEGLSDVSIDVYTYAIQPGYIDDGTTEDITTVWAKFTNNEQNYEDMFGEEATNDLSTRIELFKQISVGTDNTRTEFDINNAEDWTQLGTSFKCVDGKNYYVYGMNDKLAVDADSPALFDGFELIKAIGEAEPVSVYYFVSDDVITEQQGVGAGNADLDVLVPSVNGYHLIETQYYNPGDKLSLIDDHFNSPTESWNYIDQKTGKAAYEGQVVHEAMTLLGTAEDLDLVNVIPPEYLIYNFGYYDNTVTFLGVHASYWEDYPNITYSTLVIPDNISVNLTDAIDVNIINIQQLGSINSEGLNFVYKKTNMGYFYTGKLITQPSANQVCSVHISNSIYINPLDAYNNIVVADNTPHPHINMQAYYPNMRGVQLLQKDTIKSIVVNAFGVKLNINNHSWVETNSGTTSSTIVADPFVLNSLYLPYSFTNLQTSADITQLVCSPKLKTLLLSSTNIDLSNIVLSDSIVTLHLDTPITTQFTLPCSIKDASIRAASGANIVIPPRTTDGSVLRFSLFTSSSPCVVTYDGTCDEFNTNVFFSLSNPHLVSVQCSDGVATYDRNIDYSIPDTQVGSSARDYVFSIK